ncbi:MAG: Gldg family protein [Verrucomicrobiae bacterium]|nr:Gldg family protein [Verrucomicrobiae bacterium]
MQKRSLETVVYSGLGILLMFVLLLALNIIVGAVPLRLDLTKDKIYTLSDGTKAILKKLEAPVKIRFYCTRSETATPETVFLKNYARKVEDLLNEYKQVAGRKLIIEKYDPQPDSDAEDSARMDGLEPQMLPGVERFYLGIAVSQADARETIPFLQPTRERLLEYDITRAISRVAWPERATIGVMSWLPVFGTPTSPVMMQMGQRPVEPWTFINELRFDYNVKRIPNDAEKIDDDVSLLIVIHPKDISEKTQFAIDQFVLRGGKLIAFLDPFSLVDLRATPRGVTSFSSSSSNLDKLLKAWGYTFESKVVADLNYMMKLRGPGGQFQDAPTWLSVTPVGINRDDIACSQIDNVWLPLAGAISGAPAEGLKETVLLRSTKQSQLVEGFLANLAPDSILKDFNPSGVEYKLAIRLTGKFKTAFPDGKPGAKEEKSDSGGDSEKKATESGAEEYLKESKHETAVVLFGDADFLDDEFTLRKFDSPFGQLISIMNGNLSLAQNLIEQLTGDVSLIAVRSRAETMRPFTRIREMQAAAEQKYRAEIRRLEEKLAETQRKLNELQQKRTDQDQRFILTAEQRAEIEKFRQEERNTRIRLRQLQKDLRREIVALETRLKWINTLATPLAVTLAGLVIAVVKQRKTSAK